MTQNPLKLVNTKNKMLLTAWVILMPFEQLIPTTYGGEGEGMKLNWNEQRQKQSQSEFKPLATVWKQCSALALEHMLHVQASF